MASQTKTLPPWCIRLLASLQSADERATALASSLSAAQLNWKVQPSTWSIGQCLHHLYVTNVVYLAAIEESLKGHPEGPVDEVTPGWFGRWFIRSYIEPSSQSRRARAPKKIAPTSLVDVAILDQFLRSNQEARNTIRRASNYDVNRIRFRNPFLSLIRFTVGTGFEIVTRHEHRHLLQAERIRQSSDFPAAPCL